MLAYGRRKAKIDLWRYDLGERPAAPECPDDWRDMARDDDVIFHAHNAAFEQAIYRAICVKRWGWPEIPIRRWRCTMAKSSAANQPKALDNLVKRLGLPADAQKDKRGKELIKMLSVPTKGQKSARRARKDADGNTVKKQVETKTGKIVNRIVYDRNPKSIEYARLMGWEVFEVPGKPGQYFFREDDNLMKEFGEYCQQDVVAEMAADAALPVWREEEQELWILDQEINQRGFPVDRELCEGALKIYDRELDQANARISIVTDGAVDKCSEPKKILSWLNAQDSVKTKTPITNEHGLVVGERVEDFGDSLNKEVVAEWLAKDNLDETVREVLDLRVLAGGTAVSKYEAATRFADANNIACDQVLYHSAATGRWGGRGIQPHNMKRATILDDTYIEAITAGDYDLLEAFGQFDGYTPMGAIAQCVRGIIKAPEDHTFIISDFAGIEARVLHWLCGGHEMLELFRQGQDTYIHAALDIYGCQPEEIANWNGKKWKIKKEFSHYRDIGKAAQLGLGYGMGWKTFKENARKAGQRLGDDFAEKVVNTWRQSNHKVTEFWWGNRERGTIGIETACKIAVKSKKLVKFGRLLVWCRGGYLGIRLPSGRNLFYFNPSIDRDGRLLYHDGGKTGPAFQGGKIDTYSGKLTENIVQAIARDLLVYSMFLIRKAGLDIVIHVHDEVVILCRKVDAAKAYAIVHEAMSSYPAWAAGLPLEAETQESERFTK